MKKQALLISCALIGASLLSACDDNTSKLTSDQQFQLEQQRNTIRENERIRQHELEMARAQNPAPIVQGETRYVQSPSEVVYRDSESYHEPSVNSPQSNSSGGSVGSYVAAGAVGAVAGYAASKYASTPKGQQNIQVVKDKSRSAYDYSKQKAKVGYRFTKMKYSSATRKKR